MQSCLQANNSPQPMFTPSRGPHYDHVARVRREEIPGIHHMRVEGKDRDLGIVRNFRHSRYLKHHLPQGISISWTHLSEGQKLEPHSHPVPSMVIIAAGQGRSIGDTEKSFSGGDVVYIPAFNSHGFVGGCGGFWALSVQFQETAIFETEIDPLTQYSREHVEGDVPALEVISRGSLDTVTQAVVNGELHRLGTVKNFASHPLMQGFLPSDLSLAWVHLSRGETLSVHRHAEDSMIIVTEGEGSLLGDLSAHLAEGDIAYVPEGHAHGFCGEGEGFWALSIQFNDSSLYQDPMKPRVHFESAQPALDDLLKLNDRMSERFAGHQVFDLIRDDLLRDDGRRNRFLAALQIWSQYFQRIVLARSAFVGDAAFRDVFYEHLIEELGHDRDLEKTHNGCVTGFDAALEGMCSWFVFQTLASDNADRIVMTNLVLERAGSVFYTRYSDYLKQFAITEHFEDHSEHDDDHEKMGLELLEALHPSQYTRLEMVMRDSWDMISGILDRVVAHTLVD